MAKAEITFDSVMADLKTGRYKPVYYLMGTEDYYIDAISSYIEQHVLTDVEKEFNQTVIYGADTDIANVINTAQRYPMMAEHQVVIVKEAQNIKNIEDLLYYVQKPLESTILVLCHKQGTLDRRKKLAGEIEKIGVLYESKKLKDAQLPAFIENYVSKTGLKIDNQAVELMVEYVGGDLNRLTGELDKLAFSCKNSLIITADLVEKNIGISKEFNVFELKNAILDRNILKANRIINYFENNPKNNPIQMTVAYLFSFFSMLMQAYYAPERTDQGVASFLGLKSPWAAKDYMRGMKVFSGVKTMQIIGELRETDAKSKGIGNTSLSDGDLMKELLFKILH